MGCQYLLCQVTSQVAASNITAVNAITCEVVTALPGNTGASVLQALPASGRILRRQKGSQPDAETLTAAALVMLSADHDADKDTCNDAEDPLCLQLSQEALAWYSSWSASKIS